MADGVGFSPDNAPSQNELVLKEPPDKPTGKAGSDKELGIKGKPTEEMSPLSKGFEIWNDGTTKICYPENPLVPSSEGVHFRIESANVPLHPKSAAEWKAWISHWAKTIGVGKIVSEGRDLPDMWQSFIGKTEFSPKGMLVTEVIGRNPTGESWGRTAPLPEPSYPYDNSQDRVSQDQLQKFKATLERYFCRYWIPYVNNIELFSQEPVVSSPGSEHFKKVFEKEASNPFPWQNEPMIVTDAFNVLAILEPHLKSGVHLMVDLPDAPRRPWRNLIKSLQGLVAAEATAQLLEESNFQDRPLAAWTSIRATGSWFAGFQELSEDKNLQDENISRKWLKREYSGKKTRFSPKAGEKDWKMFFHPHIYGARSKDEIIKLTQRPKSEGGKDWEGIAAMSQKERLFVRDTLNEKLVPILVANARGKISI